MKKTGAELIVYGLEQLGITHTFGVPGVHNTEMYDSLNKSERITPILVAHEAGAAFMADAMSRTSDSTGTLVIVPAAGLTQAMSGIAEAYLDGIPMLVISGGVRQDSGRSYQLHQINQEKMLGGMIKHFKRLESHDQILSDLYEAYRIAHEGEPGPVFLEVPVEIQLFKGDIMGMDQFDGLPPTKLPDPVLVTQAAAMLQNAKNPGIYVGWGAVDAVSWTQSIAEALQAPVATTFQGLSSFPAGHPLHCGVGFGPSSIPAAQKAFESCDCLLAVGVRFSELATGSYGMTIPDNLIHIDINPSVFNRNYPAQIAIEADASEALRQISDELDAVPEDTALLELIAHEKKAYRQSWNQKPLEELVSPGLFFQALEHHVTEDSITVVDDGKHTFLTAELLPIQKGRHFISPTDFNCMGYCVPATIGAKLGNPERQVIGIVGDGAFLMTGLELITAVNYELPLAIFVFHDGELGQISQFQKTPLNRKTCTVLGAMDLEGIANGVGADCVVLKSDLDLESGMSSIFEKVEAGRTVLVDVRIDYSRKTALTKGVVKTNLGRFPLKEKLRFIFRALKRHTLG